MWNGANDPVDYPDPTDGDGPLDSDTCRMCGFYPSNPVKHGDDWLCGKCAAAKKKYTPPLYPTLEPRLI